MPAASRHALGLVHPSIAPHAKVARTIADLGGADTIELEHVAEALQYRNTADDREGTPA